MLKATLVLLLAAAATAGPAKSPPRSAGADLGPVYTLQTIIDVDNSVDRREKNFSATPGVFSNVRYYEWESYDGWFNNPAHPEWGGAGKLQ